MESTYSSGISSYFSLNGAPLTFAMGKRDNCMVFGKYGTWSFFRLDYSKCIGRKLSSLDGLLLLSLFFCLICTRQVFELGQTSLIVAVFMWLSFMVLSRSEILSGILLGIAFSKFTLALPMVFYFAYKKKIWALLFCCLTQVVGLLVLCIITQTNPAITVKAYLAGSRLVLNQTQSFAVHLSSLQWGSVSSVTHVDHHHCNISCLIMVTYSTQLLHAPRN